MSVTIRVFFDNSSATYFSGQRVKGRVILNLSKEERLTGIQLRILGEASVKWSAGGDGSVKRREVVFEKYVFVLGNYYDEVVLSSGEHVYPFAIPLASNIPPSFQSRHGFVRYTLKGKAFNSQGYAIQCKETFFVRNIIDLNTFPNLMEVVQHVKEKYLSSSCLSSGRIYFVVTVPSTGFVPGQICTVVFEIDNKSGSFVIAQARLYQLVCYKGRRRGSGKEMEMKVKKIISEKINVVEPRKCKTSCANISIPVVPTSSLPIIDIIAVSYYLRLKVYLPGTFDSEKIYVPVVIGSIPLRNQFSSPASPDTTQEQSPTPPDFSSVYPEMPPPSYEECVGESMNMRTDEDGNEIYESCSFTCS